MAFAEPDLFSTTSFPSSVRTQARDVKTVTLAAHASTDTELPVGTPMGQNRTTGFWHPWAKPVSAAFTITSDRTGGDFTLTIDGKVSAAIDAIAANCTNAVLTAAIIAMGYDADDFTVTGTDLSGAGLSVAMADYGRGGRKDVSPSVADSGTGGTALALAEDTEGVDDDGIAEITGVLHPAKKTILAAGEVISDVLIDGDVHRDDINTSTIRAVLGQSPSEADLDAALKRLDVRKAGIKVQGLAGAA